MTEALFPRDQLMLANPVPSYAAKVAQNSFSSPFYSNFRFIKPLLIFSIATASRPAIQTIQGGVPLPRTYHNKRQNAPRLQISPQLEQKVHELPVVGVIHLLLLRRVSPDSLNAIRRLSGIAARGGRTRR